MGRGESDEVRLKKKRKEKEITKLDNRKKKKTFPSCPRYVNVCLGGFDETHDEPSIFFCLHQSVMEPDEVLMLSGY